MGLFVGKNPSTQRLQHNKNLPVFISHPSQLNNFEILLLKWIIHSKTSFSSIILPLSMLEVVQEPYLNHCFLGYSFALCHRQKHSARLSSQPASRRTSLGSKETSIFPYQLIYSASQWPECIQTCISTMYINLINKV